MRGVLWHKIMYIYNWISFDKTFKITSSLKFLMVYPVCLSKKLKSTVVLKFFDVTEMLSH